MSEPPHPPAPGGPPSTWDSPRPESSSSTWGHQPHHGHLPGGTIAGGSPPGSPPPGDRPRRAARRGALLTVIVISVAAAGAGVLLLTRDDEEDASATADLSAQEREYATAITEAGDSGDGMDQVMAVCMATATVEAVGIDALREAATADELRYGSDKSLRDFGVAPLDEPGVAELARRYDECGDLLGVVTSAAQAQGARPEELACIEESVTEEAVAYATAAWYAGPATLAITTQQTLTGEIQNCGSS